MNKMVFIGGPRQVGKTTLAQHILKKKESYINWDNNEHRLNILQNKLPADKKEIIFDEIHKYKNWRSFVKGFYDTHGSGKKILVTGSARLDHFKSGGDSLFGRYHYYRLHPFSANEMTKKPTKNDIELLMNLSGFPEPLLSGKQKTYRRWSLERLRKVVFTDINELTNIRDLTHLETLIHSLSAKVGSPLSVEKLRTALEVSHNTVANWLSILESLYICFRISPFGSPKIRAVKKEQKLYLWDWAQVESPGARFENLVACHLLKYCHFIEDTEGYKMDLRYLRDRDGREVDFVVLKDDKPEFAVECKLNDAELSKNLKYFNERTLIPKFYQVHMKDSDFGSAETTARSLSFWKFCQVVGLV